jgi:hypothetical protein
MGTVWTVGMAVRTDNCATGFSKNFAEKSFLFKSRVRTEVDWRVDGDIWIVILALRRRASGRDITSSGRLIDLSFIETWKESETGRVPRGIQTGCWDVRTDASWIETSRHSGGSGRKCMSSGRMMLGLTSVRTVWHVVWMDGTLVRCASGQDGSIVRTANREPKSSIFHAVQSLLRVLWIVESMFAASLHTQVILSRMRPKY